MGLFSARQCVEVFHLAFIRALGAGSDLGLFTIKGGCNLRFFFGSIRYSEDLDVDVASVAKGTLKNKIDKLLTSPSLTLPLKTKGLTLVDVSAPKQTDTTQRWKLGLKLEGLSSPLRTKIEFSRRGGEPPKADVRVEAVAREVANQYAMPPPIAQHYLASAALSQKLRALVGRSETQARDVFDLQLLRAHLERPPALEAGLAAELPKAIDRTLGLSYADYQSQVVAYLAPEQAAPYGNREVWEAMQLDVVSLLEEMKR